MPELLPKQHLNIRLVINHENKSVQDGSPDLVSGAPARGSTMINSLNAPGLVSTSIDPPCCFTMTSWLIDRPRPVPSPAGLVVKKGLNIFSFTSGGMPMPLSRTLISTRSPLFRVEATRVGS